MSRAPRLGRTAVLSLLTVVLLGVGASAAALNLIGGKPKTPLAMPTLFSDEDLPMVARLAAPEQARADRMARQWLSTHPSRNDAAFEAYALNTVGPAPTAAVQQRELVELHRLGDHRTPQGVAASAWLELHGKKDVWKTYVKQYGQFAPKAPAGQEKALYKDAYKLSVAIVANGKTRFARPSPYQIDPSLHGVNEAKYAGTVRNSYPAKHALIGSAESTILTHFEPHRGPEFTWMTDEVAYSRMYAAGHYPSDIAAGFYLGRLLADYELAVGAPTKGA